VKRIKAFIPAAGYGERLRPITLHLPKPLLPILGMPIIETVLDRISVLSVDKVGINIHYQWEMLKEWACSSRYTGKITLFHEDPILGTGGALKNAEPFLEEAPFLVHNADIVSDIDLDFLVESHLRSGNTATLAVHDHHEFNNVRIDEHGFLHSVGRHSREDQREVRAVAFTGIAVYSPDFFRFLPDGLSSVVDAWLRAAASGMKIGTLDFTGSRWSDIGTPDSYAGIVFDALKQEGEIMHVDPSTCCDGAYPGGNTVIERDCVIGNGARLGNCIALPGATIGEGAEVENAIVGPDYVVPLRDTEEIPPSLPSPVLASFTAGAGYATKISLIGTGGSDRNYYRIAMGKKSAVLMVCPKDDPDIKRHLVYTEFFRKHTVPVPELLSPDAVDTHISAGTEMHRYVLFEDLGDVSLYSRLKCRRTTETVEQLYRRVLDILVKLHSVVSADASECPLLESRVFDYAHFRWETDYFRDRFVSRLHGIALPERGELDREFDRLARDADSFAKSIVHRDFQSQNIMVTGKDVPRIIDFQGARMGPPAYDLVSLLWDPYHRIEAATRTRLVDYYIYLMKDQPDGSFDENAFRQSILPCRLQRHMQALGAYAFLSKVKGKTYFEKYIPQALRYLKEEAEVAADEYPVLFSLAGRISERTLH
jgi:NDP-sugar pyrophosphorylase family protein/aminoglycoside/choline kinase family phosphotransferase